MAGLLAVTACAPATPGASAAPQATTPGGSPTTTVTTAPTTSAVTTASASAVAFVGDLRKLFIAKPSGSVSTTSKRYGADNKITLDELNKSWSGGTEQARSWLVGLEFKRGEHAQWIEPDGDIVLATLLQFGAPDMAQEVFDLHLSTNQGIHGIITVDGVENGFMMVYPLESDPDDPVATCYFSKGDLFMELVVLSDKDVQKTATDLLIQQYRRLP